jgi:uncharacterized membrane protein YsdA (DUF1294 family)
MFEAFLIFCAVMSVAAFYSYGADKRRAERSDWRIRESTLLALSFLGGALGALLGMKVYRHKTRHTAFWVVGFLGIVWQSSLAIALFRVGM